MARVKTMMAGLFAMVLAFGLMTTAVPVEAQQAGLVNVAVGDIDIDTGDIINVENNRVGIGVAATIAANVCGVTAQVGVVAQQVARTGGFDCTNDSNTRSVVITR